jgi:hypothetical protein
MVQPACQAEWSDPFGAAADSFVPADPFSGFGGPEKLTSKRQSQGLRPLTMTSLPSSTFNSTPLEPLPTRFASSTSFYTTCSHDIFISTLSNILEGNDNCDFNCENNKIVGITHAPGESSWTVGLFQADNRLAVEFKRTFGCPFAFRQFYNYVVTTPAIATIISEFFTSAPSSSSLGLLDASDLPPLDDLPPMDSELGGEDPLANPVALLKSQFVVDQREGAMEILSLTKDADTVRAADADRLVGELCDLNLLLAGDSCVARNACELLENLCCADSLDFIRSKVWKLLLDAMMHVLDSPDSLSTRKCKRHIARAMQAITAAGNCQMPPEKGDQYESILRAYTKNPHLSAPITATLEQIGWC